MSEQLENEFSQALSENLAGKGDFQTSALRLAQILTDAASEKISSEQAGHLISSDIALMSVLKILSGRQMSTAEAVISIGQGSQTGDIHIANAAGRDVLNVTLNIANTKDILSRSTSTANRPKPQRTTTYYNSQDDAFNSWSLFSDAGRLYQSFRVINVDATDYVALEMRAHGRESVGPCKSLPLLWGKVDFEYKVVSSSTNMPNVMFYMIPMQETGLGRTGLIEVGTEFEDDPRGPLSPYRVKSFAPVEYYGDGKWHIHKLTFDFRQTPTAFYCIFGPRINEGTSFKGAAMVQIRNVRVFSGKNR